MFQQTWDYPGGIKSPTKPSDGEMHIIWDSLGYPKFIHQWNDANGLWMDVTHTAPCPPSNTVELDLVQEFDRLVEEGNKCECGSSAVGSSIHSSWCRKHTN